MKAGEMEESIARLAELWGESSRTVVLTGAGISTESGIPDFRSPGGVWDRYDPQDFLFPNFMATEEKRINYWRMSREFFSGIREAKPNPAHKALAELEKMGKLDFVLTQNVDNLHQKAGNTPNRVVELHGTVFTVSCLSCGKKYSREEIERRIDQGVQVPACDECPGFLKPDTVSFGQTLPQDAINTAFEAAANCDLFVVIGSSLVVNPAAQLPVHAVHNGAGLVIIGLEPTPCDTFARLTLRGKAGEILPKMVSRMADAVLSG
jgi:NAD-dependent deacetylase